MDIHQTYQRRGFGPAMAKFIALVSQQGPLSPGYADQPAPDPAMFGLPVEDDGSRNDPLVGQNIVSCLSYQHNFDALRAAPDRPVSSSVSESASPRRRLVKSARARLRGNA